MKPAPIGASASNPAATLDAVSGAAARALPQPAFIASALPKASGSAPAAVVRIAAAPAPATAIATARPATASGAITSVLSGLLGAGPDSPLGWGVLATVSNHIGRVRRDDAPTGGIASITASAAPAAVGPPGTPPPFAENEVLIAFKPGSTAKGRENALASVKASVKGRLGTKDMLATDQGVIYRLHVPGGSQAAIAALSKNPNVAFVEPNYKLTSGAVVAEPYASPNDPYYTGGSLWGMESDDSPTRYGPAGTTNQYGSGAEEAWGLGVTGSRNVVVGIIDEGIQITHPDLAANIWTNTREVAGDGIDNDGNGYVDDIHGWDFYYHDNSVYDGSAANPDIDAHGTHVAGTIGGIGNNGTGVSGVNQQVTIIPAKFLGPQGGYTSDAVEALYYLTDLKTRQNLNLVAVNNSWGGGGYSSAMQSAINRAAKADILFVAAAGNSTSNNDATASYPSNYSSLKSTATESAAFYESVIAVASITSTGLISSFSSYGATTVDIGAPGSGIISTVPTDSYASYYGTSMATPHVTGALALYASQNPTATAAALRSAILGNAKPTTSLAGKTVTGGRLSLEGLFVALEPPVASISPANVSVVEGDSGLTPAQFTVSLSKAAASPVTVTYATADGTATAGTDYTAASGTVTIAAGDTSAQVIVNVAGDTSVESDETFTVTLSAPSGATLGTSAATGTITNDDKPLVSISANVTVAEGNTGVNPAQFTVSLSQAPVAPVSVNYATADGSATAGQDYTASSGTVTFVAGQITQQISVDVDGDSVLESDETFTVTLSAPSGAVLGGGTTATATIVNDDQPGSSLPMVSISPVNLSVAEGNSGVTTAAFTVSLSAASSDLVTVNYATANGSAAAGTDYTASNGTVTIAAGQTSAQILVDVIGDSSVESDETFTLTLSAPSGATLGMATATATIVNDDVPTAYISPVSVRIAEGNSGAKTVQLTVSLSQPSMAPVTVNYTTANGSATAGSDYTAASGTLTFAPGVTSQQVNISVAGDTAVEADETFTVALSSPTAAVLGTATATATITNDDGPVLSIKSLSLTEGNSGTKTATFTVSLSARSTTPVTVAYSTADGAATAGSDYTATSGTLTFAPGVTSQQVTVDVIGDTAVEANETFTVALSAPTNALLGAARTATGTITNDDTPVVSISPVVLVTEGNSGTTPVQFTVSLSEAAFTPVTVKYVTSNGTASAGKDYTKASGTLTFAAGETSKQVIVNVIGDTAVENDETLTVTLSSPSGATLGTAKSTATITNDDLPTVAISAASATVAEGNLGTKESTFTVRLSNAMATPVTVSYATADGTASAGQDYTAKSGTVTFAPGVTSQQVTVDVIGDTAVEANEAFTVALSSPSGAQLGAAGTVTGTISNDDKPVVSISLLNSAMAESNSESAAMVFTVSLSEAAFTPVTVRYATGNGTASAGSDYTAASGTLTFAPAVTTQEVRVNVIGDTAVEASETFTVTLSSPSGATLGTAKATATITNDDVAPSASAVRA